MVSAAHREQLCMAAHYIERSMERIRISCVALSADPDLRFGVTDLLAGAVFNDLQIAHEAIQGFRREEVSNG
jgi:hypothetical protein